MRGSTPTSRRHYRTQSALRSPLNRVLGAETHVRILRALSEIKAPIGLPELSRRIQMDKAGVWRAARVLENLGVIEGIGVGKQQRVRLRRDYPLLPDLVALFDGERRRFEKLIAALTEASRALTPPPLAVWIEGAVVAEADRPGDALTVGVLDTSENLARTVDGLARHVAKFEETFDVTIYTRGLTRADLAVMDSEALEGLENVIMLAGVPPAALVPDAAGSTGRKKRSSPVTHRLREDQSLALARALAQRISRDPTIVSRARAYLKKRMSNASRRESSELEEWARILDTASPARLRSLLTDTSERAVRLRQSAPFLPALSPAERQSLIDTLTDRPVMRRR